MEPWGLPELAESGLGIIRIPSQVDVSISNRVRRLIDSPPFQRLSKISQLGLVSLVYPGATHSRFEHSLGVYRRATQYLRCLAKDAAFVSAIDERAAKSLLVAALLHDVGHWPFCHPLEDIGIAGLERHEILARKYIENDSIANCLVKDWQIEPHDVFDLLAHGPEGWRNPIAASVLSGPIDIDKMDYLERDSLHAGVPYGQNFDQSRLIHSLCLDPKAQRLAITDKGRTAAEMMVFARYVMFSEVYWHHAVRCATAMLQRGVLRLTQINPSQSLIDSWQTMDEPHMRESLRNASSELDKISKTSGELFRGLFGSTRQLYKRAAQFNCHEQSELHRALSHRPYIELCQISDRLSTALAEATGQSIGPDEVLVDAPPVKLEVQFKLSVRNTHGEFRALSELSPVVKTLATEQFDAVVKNVRIFVAPRIREAIRKVNVPKILSDVI